MPFRTTVGMLSALALVGCDASSLSKGDVKGGPAPEDFAEESRAKGEERLLPGTVRQAALETTDARYLDGTYFDRWMFEGRAGDQIRASMRSEELDSYLLLYRDTPQGPEFVAEDDDSGGDLNSLLTTTLEESGSYSLLANSFEVETGAYEIRLDIVTSEVDRISSRSWDSIYPGGGDPSDRYALLVGIDDYPGTQNDLTGPAADARIIRDVLIEDYGFPPENVLLLLDEEGNREQILNAFIRHLGQAGPDGLALFFYSGHGVQMRGNYGLTAPLDPEGDGRDEALAVWGAQGSNIILDDELGFTADRLNAGRILILLDACFSGTGTRGAGGQPKRVSVGDLEDLEMPGAFLGGEIAPGAGGASTTTGIDLTGEPRRHILLSASADDELAYTADGWDEFGGVASVFTYYLARGLQGAADDITFDQLGLQIREQAREYTEEVYQATQTAQIEGQRRGERVRAFLGGGAGSRR